MKNSQRVFYFDVLRVMAIIGIIFCHVSKDYIMKDMGTLNFYISAFYDCFRDFSVPIFVMLSGALLIGKKDSLLHFFKKRLSRILIPFIFWSILTIIYSFSYIKHSIDFNNAIDIILGHSGTMGVTFWFIWMIIIVYVGVFFVNKIIEHGNKKIEGFDKKFITILTILSVVYIILYQQHVFVSAYYSTILSYYISFLTFAIIGYYIANTNFVQTKVKTNKLVIITAILSAVSYISYIYLYVVPLSLENYHFYYLPYFTIQILIISASIFLMFKYLSNTESFKKINSKYGDPIITLSKYSYGIYLCHYLVFFYLKRLLIPYVNLLSLNSIIAIPILVAIILTISMIILWILNKIPYINRITGVN